MNSVTECRHLGQFLLTDNVYDAATIATRLLNNIPEPDMKLIENILESNWSTEEQMVSNLLQNPFLIPKHLIFKKISQALKDQSHPYYILSATVGFTKVIFQENELKSLLEQLKKSSLHKQGIIAMRAFISLLPYIQYPQDIEFFIDILKIKKSSLHRNLLSWLVLNVNEKSELIETLRSHCVNREMLDMLQEKIEAHEHSIQQGEQSPTSIEVIDYVPDLEDFTAMREKEETLSGFFDDLDFDSSGYVSLEQVMSFLEDIGENMKVVDIKHEMETIGVNENGNIDRDGFIELMFPKFQVL